MSSSQQNHSKYYYVSNENMSDIKESIEEYSMNFQKQSGNYGNSKSEIMEMISGSHQVTQSKGQFKSKPPVPKQPVIVEEHIDNPARQHNHPIQPQKKAVYLGDHVYNTIRERYFQTNKITTDDPQVLYDFFLSQRKTLNHMKPISEQQIMKQMPSMQRKLMVKQQFQRILTYYPDDVFYSLCFEAEKIKKDRELAQKVELYSREVQKQNKKKASKKDIDKIVQKLYKTKGQFPQNPQKVSDEEIQKVKRWNFGRNLSQHFQNTYRERGSPTNIQTADKLYTFWEDLYEREEHGIEWPEQTAKETIHQYMYEQVEDLMNYAKRKLGFKCGKAISLYKLYTKNYETIQDIYIPLNSFQEYVKEYNEAQNKKMELEENKTKENWNKEVEKRKKSEVKRFGRPVSATPLTILSKPKTQGAKLNDLLNKYPNDKVIKAMVAEENLKKPRYPMEYGVYHIQEEVKTKQWIRIDPKKPAELYDEKINKQLYKTFTNPEFFKVEKNDRLMSLFAEDNLSNDEEWKQLGPLMKQAMLVKAYEHKWFVECIQRYVERTSGENLKMETNTVLIKKLFKHLDDLESDSRASELQKLESLIQTSESIAEKTEKINSLGQEKMSAAQKKKQRELLFVKLEEKAIEYVKLRIQKNDEKFMLRNFLNKLFEQLLKEHKQYVTSHYHVVKGCDKQCPKLLKYEFFRLVKEINPMQMQRETSIKSHVWVPSSRCPETNNYNSFAECYKKNKNIILPEPEKDQLKTGLWGRKKGTDRELLMMTYQDSKQCTFQPKISKRM